MNIKRPLFLFVFLISILFAQLSIAQTQSPTSTQGQTQSINMQDLSTVKVDNLTDAQVMKIWQQAQASGLSQDQLAQLAQARGMAPQEIQKLRDRITSLQNGSNQKATSGTTTTNSNGRTVETATNGSQLNSDTSKNSLNNLLGQLVPPKPKIFGQDLFKNPANTFEPNLRLPTPKNYVIGAADQLLIDIYGSSEASYQLTVSPDGNINIPYAGVIPVSGLSIEAATGRIKAKLSKAYAGLSNGSTKLNISLGNIRSIKVVVNGEVMKPGTYTLPSLATVFNALYSSGGPTETGSFRNIEIIREGRKIATLDVYDFLTNGDLKNNVILHDQDIINVPPYDKRVEVVGEIKRPAIYEMRGKETLSALIRYAGGFTERAYRARVKVLKNTATEHKINDVVADQFNVYVPESGDKYYIDSIISRFENRVTIAGAVFRPGQYELDQGLTLRKLIEKANGLKEDAFLSRGYITRLTSDLNTEIVSFDVKKIVNGQATDIPLMREDSVSISSIFDLKELYKVNINGEVRFPGEFPYSENMSLEELIIKSGGFKESATPQRIEISRRVKNSDVTSSGAQIAEIFQKDVNKDLGLDAAKFILQPFDIVSIRPAAGYEVQKQVQLDGEILYPGFYTVAKKNERISDLIKRAGGLTTLAFPQGASLKRVGDQSSKLKDEIEQQKLSQLLKLQHDANDTLSANAVKQAVRNNFVGIDLPDIMKTPGGINDLFLEDGDVIYVPKQLQTVKISGEVLSPVTVIYQSSKSFKSYVDNAGGFSEKALRKRAYVVFANGLVKSTHKFLFFNIYPEVKQGAEIFVPTKEESAGLTAQQWVGIGTGLATIATLIYAITKK